MFKWTEVKWRLRNVGYRCQVDCKNIKETDLPIITINSVKKIFAVLNDELQYKEREQTKSPNFLGLQFRSCGVSRDRTGDTRIFSPLLYRLSYRTSFPFGAANIRASLKFQKRNSKILLSLQSSVNGNAFSIPLRGINVAF